MKKIDVTNKMEFFGNKDNSAYRIKCICGKWFDYHITIRNFEGTQRTMWDCPKCKAQLYFGFVKDGMSQVIQVIDD